MEFEWKIVVLNFFYAVLGVILMYITYRAFDKLTPEMNFAEELKKGNVAVAVFIGSVFIAIAMIIAGSLN
jgi:uncharacterized membrane protein YjfL (UPF0719 family)